MVFRKDKWRAVDDQIADHLLDLDPSSDEYANAVKNYRTIKEAQGDKPRCKIDPNVLINAGVIIGTCFLTIYGENVLNQVVYSKFWPKILLPKL